MGRKPETLSGTGMQAVEARTLRDAHRPSGEGIMRTARIDTPWGAGSDILQSTNLRTQTRERRK